MISKVYVFELKQTKELYAYTSDKKIAKSFLEERDKDSFHYYCLDLNKLDEKEQEKMVMKISFDGSNKIDKIGVLFDGKNYIPIYMTLKEILEVKDVCDMIHNSINYTYGVLAYEDYDDFSLNKDELKTISMLTDFIRVDNFPYKYKQYEKFNNNINSYKVFYNLFGYTLDSKINIK